MTKRYLTSPFSMRSHHSLIWSTRIGSMSITGVCAMGVNEHLDLGFEESATILCAHDLFD